MGRVRVDGAVAGAPREGFDTIVPDGCPELILQLGDPYESVVKGRIEQQPSKRTQP